MSKITKTNLARGAFLTSQHIENNLSPVSNLIDEKLDNNNLAEHKVPFYVNFTFPTFKTGMFGLTDDEKQSAVDGSLVFPIPLIPTQDHFDEGGKLTIETPTYLLDSISVSMDLRGEGCAVPPHQPTVLNVDSKGWKINYEKAQEQDIVLSLFQKDYSVLSNSNKTPTNSIFSTTIPATIAFAGSEARVENPYYIYGINKQINPYKSYYLGFHFPNQGSGTSTSDWVINDLVISFKFYTILDTLEETYSTTRNKSTKNDTSTITPYNIGLTAPAPYTVISAENSTSGLQTNLNKIDEFVEEKLTTGQDKFGNIGTFQYNDAGTGIDTMTSQAIKTPAVYDVIVVPMWQGTIGGSGAITTYHNYTSLGIKTSDVVAGAINPDDYEINTEEHTTTLNRFQGYIQDIRTIPLFYPFTIHHVLAYHNEQIKTLNGINYETFGNGTTTGVITGNIGVGLGTCFQADRYTYDQIAYLEYNNTFNNQIDDIILLNNKYGRDNVYGVSAKRSGRLLQVPIFPAGAGKGFYANGVPYYCGGGTKSFETRSGFPDTQGMENFIEIRWQFKSAGGVWFDDASVINTKPQTIAGIGGHFVYLIGKKLLTTNRNNLQE